MKKKFRENISDMFDLPKDTFVDLPKIILTGNREIYVENYRGILEYTDSVIRLNIGANALKVCGEELDIRAIGEEDITLNGTISSIEFC